MKFKPIKCPECGKDARGTLEEMTGVAGFYYDKRGKLAKYSGNTEIFWDGQSTVVRNGKTVLICHEGHDWEAVGA